MQDFLQVYFANVRVVVAKVEQMSARHFMYTALTNKQRFMLLTPVVTKHHQIEDRIDKSCGRCGRSINSLALSNLYVL